MAITIDRGWQCVRDRRNGFLRLPDPLWLRPDSERRLRRLVTKINPAVSALVYSTSWWIVRRLRRADQRDGAGNAYIVRPQRSPNSYDGGSVSADPWRSGRYGFVRFTGS